MNEAASRVDWPIVQRIVCAEMKKAESMGELAVRCQRKMYAEMMKSCLRTCLLDDNLLDLEEEDENERKIAWII